MSHITRLYCPTCRGTPFEFHFEKGGPNGFIDATCLVCAERGALIYTTKRKEESSEQEEIWTSLEDEPASKEEQPSSQRVEIPSSTG